MMWTLLLACSDESSPPSAEHAATGSSTSGQSGAGGEGLASTGAAGSASASAGGSAPAGPKYAVSSYVVPELWLKLRRTSALDSTERLFVTDGPNLYAISDGVPSVYLSYDEVKAAAGVAPEEEFYGTIHSIDVGPDDRVYFLVSVPGNVAVLVSDAPHTATRLYAETNCTSAGVIAVQSASRILLFINSGEVGLAEVAQGGLLPIFSSTTMLSFARDGLVEPDGWLWHVPNPAPAVVVGGSTYDDTLGIILDASDLGECQSWYFSSVARDGAGGAIVAMERTLYQVDRDGSAIELVLSPTLADFPYDTGVSWEFFEPYVEVATSGTIYIVEPHAGAIVRAFPQGTDRR